MEKIKQGVITLKNNTKMKIMLGIIVILIIAIVGIIVYMNNNKKQYVRCII